MVLNGKIQPALLHLQRVERAFLFVQGGHVGADDYEGALNNIREVFALDARALGCSF